MIELIRKVENLAQRLGRLETLESPAVSYGAAWPASWPAGVPFYNSAYGMSAVWDGSRWLSAQVFERVFPYASSISVTTELAAPLIAGIQAMPGALQPYFVQMDYAVGIGATNNGANYWGVALRHSGTTTIQQSDTKLLIAGGGQQRITVSTSFAQPGLAPIYINLRADKVGAPTPIDLYGVACFRLILP